LEWFQQLGALGFLQNSLPDELLWNFSISFWGVDFMTSTNGGANYLVATQIFLEPKKPQKLGKMNPPNFDEHIFSDGLKPTSN